MTEADDTHRDSDAKNRVLDLLPMLGALLVVTGALTWGDLWAQHHFGLIAPDAAAVHDTATRDEASRRVLDFTADDLPDGKPGLVVTSVRSDGNAEHAGLVVGDRIVHVDGRRPTSFGSLAQELSERGRQPMHLDVVHLGAVRRIDLAGTPQAGNP
ncbi:PDZ domain-containing protein [Novosphingobium sp. BL-8H]|uniref:PDZ domain-containing protein n=1 Tax=Novosphingobium sp. BL-8H TaxID=3127640 RepID=UPI0037577474